jgi:hypothetical protein
MEQIEGVWRLIDSRAINEKTSRLSAPYGANPQGIMEFCNGRMLVALCNGDTHIHPDKDREFSSYGGRYRFDGNTLSVDVDVASDIARIGSHRVRNIVMIGDQMILRPPPRLYGTALQRRELVWERA